MALTADRNTPVKDGELVAVPMAAGAVAFAGGLAVADANGYAAPGSAAVGLTYLGRFEEARSNAAGQNGSDVVLVRRKKAFKFNNSGSDPVTQASMGQACYIEDDETVAATDGAGSLSAAGIVIGVESDGVWVE